MLSMYLGRVIFWENMDKHKNPNLGRNLLVHKKIVYFLYKQPSVLLP